MSANLLRTASWLTTLAAALPLMACIGLRRWGRSPSREVWLITLAFAVSFAMDVVSWRLAIAHSPNAWVGFVGYPVQFGLLMWAVGRDAPARWIGLVAVTLVGVAVSALPVSFAVTGRLVEVPPEVFVRGGGALGVAALLLENPFLDRFRGPVLLYVLGCLPFIAGMILFRRGGDVWFAAWGGYQVVRVAAIGWTTAALIGPHVPEFTDLPPFRGRQRVRSPQSVA